MKLGCMPDNSQTRFAAMQTLAQTAEEVGFASFWLADHLIFRFGESEEGIWEVFTFLSGLAATTKSIQLGPLVACTSFRNPALLAKMADSLDEISQGRFILGLGAGWHEPEYTAFGYPFDHLASRFEESLQVIVPLLREGQVDFTGHYVQARNARLVPRGPSPKGPPIWVGARKPRMLQLIAKYADAWNTVWHIDPAKVTERYADMLVACQQVGRDPATLALTAGTRARILADGESVPAEAQDLPIPGIVGTAEEVTEQLRGFAAVGVSHLVVITPSDSPEQVARFAPVVAALAQA